VRGTRPKPRILLGDDEPIFQVLPLEVLDNLRRPASEAALVWNLIYPLAKPTLSFAELLNIRPLWGTPGLSADDELTPYYWGCNADGQRLAALDDILREIDGSGKPTEVDLFLVGRGHLVAAEAKNLASLGRCSRFMAGRCPEMHRTQEAAGLACRYWEPGPAQFDRWLDFGPRPTPSDPPPPCSRHYQLGRTLLVGGSLASALGLRFHLWLITPRSRWRSFQSAWLEFVEQLRSEELWRAARVLAWEDIRALGRRA